MFLMANVLFGIKYLSRFSFQVAIVVSMIYMLAVGITYASYRKYIYSFQKKYIWILLGIFIIISVVALSIISQETLRVDRWRVVDSFWHSVGEGLYPYAQKNSDGNYPGPMPFYFILCYPFHFIHEMGFASLFSAVLFLLFSYHKREEKDGFVFVSLLLLSSCAIFWEIITRSTIFFNAVLFFLFIMSLKKFPQKFDLKFYLSAFVGGLLFSTRAVFVIPMVVWAMYALRIEKVCFITLTKWGIIFFTTFMITLLPFLILWNDEFFIMNPFIVQSSFLLPFGYILVFIFFSFVSGFYCQKFQDVVFLSAILLFGMAMAQLIYQIFQSGMQAYWNTGADISYFLFSFPFLLYIIGFSNKKHVFLNQ